VPRALVDRIIVGPDGLEYRLMQGKPVPGMPADLAGHLEAQAYIETPGQQAEIQSASRPPKLKKGSEKPWHS
jgi:hypothetical protein